MPSKQPVASRLRDKYVIEPDGCWRWTARIGREGYGRIWSSRPNRKCMLAHRVTFEEYRGPIPNGLQLDHLCRNRACVNPDHLEPVTCRENLMRGAHPSAVTFRAGTCGNGHVGGKPREKGGCDTCRQARRDREREAYRASRVGKVDGRKVPRSRTMPRLRWEPDEVGAA